jgi:integrase
MGSGNVTCTTSAAGLTVCYGRVTKDGEKIRGKGFAVTKQRTLSAAKRLAAASLREKIRLWEQHKLPDPLKERTTLREWVGLASDTGWAATRKADLQPWSWVRYEGLLRNHILPRLGKLRLGAIGPPQILEWRDWMQRKPGPNGPRALTEVRAAETLLRACLKDAAVSKYPTDDAIHKMRHVKAKHTKPPAITAAQFLKLLEAAAGDPAGEPWRTMYVTAYFGMTRDGETRGLDWRHVLFASSQIDVSQQYDRLGKVRDPKEGSTGLVDLPAEAMAVLLHHQLTAEHALGRAVGLDEPVFTWKGRRIKYEMARRTLKRHLAAAGLPDDIGWHSFRRGGATAHASVSTDPLTLRQLMRHTDIAVTQGYIRPVAMGGRAAAERVAARVREQ